MTSTRIGCRSIAANLSSNHNISRINKHRLEIHLHRATRHGPGQTNGDVEPGEPNPRL